MPLLFPHTYMLTENMVMLTILKKNLKFLQSVFDIQWNYGGNWVSKK